MQKEMSLLSVIVISMTVQCVSCFYSNFKNPQIALPKCCPFDEHLKFTGSYNCVHSEEYFQIFTESVRDFSSCSSQCIDFVVNEDAKHTLVEYDCLKRTFRPIEYSAYPKCCRLGLSYDEAEHRCIESDRVMNLEGVTIFNISLSHCPLKTHAIVDYLDHDDSLRIDFSLAASLSNQIFQYGSYCLDDTPNGTSLVRACQKYEDVCKTSIDDHKITCIRKCCPDGQAYKNSKKCVKTFNHGIHLKNNFFRTIEEDKFAIIQSHIGTKYPMKPEHDCEIDNIGNLKCVIINETQVYNSLDAIYCTEVRESRGVVQQMVFLFFHKRLDKPDVNFVISSILLLISAFFLAFTLITYLLTSKWMKLFEKANCCYCLITLIAYVSLATTQFKPYNLWSYTACVSLGFLIMFTFLGSFTWLNIICFDMYMAFGTMKLIKVGNKKRDRKRFLFYNLYGWGVPTLLTLITYVIYKTECVPEVIRPKIGNGRCFFDSSQKDSYDHLLYFVLPLTVLIVCNAVLFLKTIIYYFKVKTEINSMNDNYATDKEKRFKLFNADREKMIMLLKLFLVMGISWLFEVFSNVVSFKSNGVLQVIEIIWDSFNSLQGLFIFCIFMVKAKTWEALKKKFCPAFGRRHSEHSSATLGTTLYSTTEDPRSIRLMSREKSIEKDY